ncbi:unnamed protein product, partial [Didymodactylos carnosus]
MDTSYIPSTLDVSDDNEDDITATPSQDDHFSQCLDDFQSDSNSDTDDDESDDIDDIIASLDMNNKIKFYSTSALTIHAACLTIIKLARRLNLNKSGIKELLDSLRSLLPMDAKLPRTVLGLMQIIASHFLHYFIYIRILHFYRDVNQLNDLEHFFDYYYRYLAQYYGPKSELCTIHMHIHLLAQVKRHGALALTSCFPRESFLGNAMNWCHGKTYILEQFITWYNIDRTLRVEKTLNLNQLFYDTRYDEKYLDIQFVHSVHDQFVSCCENKNIPFDQSASPKIYARHWRGLKTFHSRSYKRGGNAVSSKEEVEELSSRFAREADSEEFVIPENQCEYPIGQHEENASGNDDDSVYSRKKETKFTGKRTGKISSTADDFIPPLSDIVPSSTSPIGRNDLNYQNLEYDRLFPKGITSQPRPTTNSQIQFERKGTTVHHRPTSSSLSESSDSGQEESKTRWEKNKESLLRPNVDLLSRVKKRKYTLL